MGPVKTFARLLAEITPWLLESFCGEFTAARILTAFTLFNLAIAGTAAHRIASAITLETLPSQIRTLLALWAVACTSILLWAACLIVLHIYDMA
jgi:hypothetical protein